MKPPKFSKIERRRLDEILRRSIPESYNSFNRRFTRAVEVLLHVRYKIPGDERDGKLVYTTREKATEVLVFNTKPWSGPANALIGLLREAVATAQSDAALAKSQKATRQRDGDSGKFLLTEKKLKKVLGGSCDQFSAPIKPRKPSNRSPA